MDPKVRLNRRLRAAAGPTPPAEIEASKHGIFPKPDYENRPGYTESFLGDDHTIRLPWLTDEQYANTATNRSALRRRHVLPYHHFSVVMNRRRRLAHLTACNIDGRRQIDISRDDFDDKRFMDPRLLPEEQLQNGLYASNSLEPGQLVRRLDASWGGTLTQAKAAHDDTFHWTNCSPLHERLNRNKSIWGRVEDYILNKPKTRNRRVTVFAGPVFRDDDPVYSAESGHRVQFPRQYWKVVARVKDEGELSATAYISSQEELVDRTLGFAFGAFKSFQTTVRIVEQLTGLSFWQLSEHDPLEGVEEVCGPRIVEMLGSWRRMPVVPDSRSKPDS